MGLGMKHELDPDQYRALLKEIRKLGDEIQEGKDILYLIAVSEYSNSPEESLENAKTLKELYLKQKYERKVGF